MRYLLALGLCFVSACSFESSEPDVHPAVVQSVDAMKADSDCRGLQAAFDRHDQYETLAYIDDALSDAGCYD